MGLIIAEENLIIQLLHTQKAGGKKKRSKKKPAEVYQIFKSLMNFKTNLLIRFWSLTHDFQTVSNMAVGIVRLVCYLIR